MALHDLNYNDFDIPDGASLNEDERHMIADSLRQSFEDLQPLRLNKQATFAYCNERFHLPPEQKSGPFSFADTFHARVEDETLIIGEIEHDLSHDGKLFLYAMFSLSSKDKYYWGYLWNFLNDEICERRIVKWHNNPVSDNAVEFAAKFDYEDLASYVRGKEDIPIKERYIYIKRVLTDCKAWGLKKFSEQEKRELIEPVVKRIELLVEEIHNELPYAEDGQHTNQSQPFPAQPGNHKESVQSIGLRDSHSFNTVNKELYYNPSILGTEHFSDFDFQLFPDYDHTDKDNYTFFLYWLEYVFVHSYFFDKEKKELRLEVAKKYDACKKIRALFDDFIERLNRSPREWTFLYKMDCIAYWVKRTFEALDTASKDYGLLISESYGDPENSDVISTSPLKNSLIYTTFNALLSKKEEICGAVPDKYWNVVFYNFWPDTFEEDQVRFGDHLGLPEEKRAELFFSPNVDFFRSRLRKKCEEFIHHKYSSPEEYITFRSKTKDQNSQMLGVLFYDYNVRIAKDEPLLSVRTNAGLRWIFDSMETVRDMLMDSYNNLRHLSPELLRNAEGDTEFFFIDCCLCLLFVMWKNFIEDNTLIYTKSIQQSHKNTAVTSTEKTGRSEPRAETKATEGVTYILNQKDNVLVFFAGVKQDSVKQVVTEHIINHVGIEPGESELVVFSALEFMNILKVPSYSSFKSMFPRYNNKSMENTYCHYLGNNGVLRGFLCEKKKHKAEVNSSIKELGSLIGIPIDKFLRK